MIEVKKAGLYSSIQDLGRFGYRDQGVPLSGAMDQYSAVFANQLLGNEADTPLLEFALQGPELYFNQPCRIAITGTDWDIELNSQAIALNRPVIVAAGSTLKCSHARKGMYAYLAVENGFEAPKVLGSASYYPGITPIEKISKGQKLALIQSIGKKENLHSKAVYKGEMFKKESILVHAGADLEQLSKTDKKALLNYKFKISKDSNRMAYILEHDLDLSAEEITTAPVEPGTVQLTPSGKLIVLMRDAQTTGGYARILQLSPMAINQLTQKRPGEEVGFELV